MIIYRALNEYDIKLNPTENGIIAKKNYEEAFNEFINLIEYNNKIACTNDMRNELYDLFMNEMFETLKVYLIAKKLENQIDFIGSYKKCKERENNGDDYDLNKQYFMEELSTRNSHILRGSKEKTFWISFTKSFDVLLNYYKQQDHHLVAYMEYDESINLTKYDVSEKGNYEKQMCFNKIVDGRIYMTKTNSRAANYSVKNKELVFYNYIPEDNISILTPLNMDMFYANMINEDYLKLDNKTKNTFNRWLKYKLSLALKDKNNIINFIYDKLYNENLSLNYICKTYNINYDDLIKVKEELLYILNDIDISYKNKINGNIKVLKM